MEDYKEKYEMALERAKKLQETCDSTAIVGWCEYIFPELCESEDERIRKELKHYLEERRCQTQSDEEYINCNKFLNWLEKQGTSYTKKDVDDAYVEGMALAKDELEKQGNQNHIEQNLEMVEALRTEYEKGRADAFAQMQKERSEEDEKCIRLSTDIIDSALRAGFCVQLDRDRCIDWFNSLKERYIWKPSYKQIAVLKIAADGCADQTVSQILSTLYKDLKKLKGE